MTLHIGSGGSYKTVLGGTAGAGTAIGVGGVWKSIRGMWVGSGGAWKKFFDATPAINTSASLSCSRSGGAAAIYAGIQLNSDGTTLFNNASGTSTFDVSADPWLSSGVASLAYVERTSGSGTLNWIDDTGGGRVQMNANRQLGCLDTTNDSNPSFAGITLNFYDAASGGTLLGSIGPITIQASKTS
jgi:hypothetical protein